MCTFYNPGKTTSTAIKNNGNLVFFLFFVFIITSKSYGQISLRGTQTNTTTNTTLKINKPAGLAVGDLMLANILQSGNDNSSLSNPSISGWTIIAGSNLNSGDNRWRATLFYKVATATDVSVTDFSFSLDNDSFDGEGGITAFSGVDVAGGIFDVSPGTVYTNINTDNTLTASAITTNSANSAIVMFGVLRDDQSITDNSWSTTSPGSLTELYDLPFNANLDMGIAAAWATKSTIGSTGTGTATISSSTNNGAILIALKAAVLSPTISSFTPNSGCPNSTSVVITGTNFTGATEVKFNGAIATFVVNNSTQITATVPATATSGKITVTTPGGTATSSGDFTVTPNNTVGLPSSTPTLCINTPLSNITHSTTGATGIGVATGLPAGVSASWSSNTVTISGTPTAAGTYNYTIPLTGGCGNVSATGTITVTPNNAAAVASSTPSICINTSLSNITHSTTSAMGISNNGISGANGLPTGVSATWASNTITISGTPTADGIFNYSIPLTGGCNSANATGTITVTANNTVGTASSSPTLCINSPLSAITHNTTGATGIGSATGLPAGVNAGWAMDMLTISGTPTQAGTFNYSIPLTGGCGAVNATGTITILSNTTGGGSSSPTLCINSALTDITHSTSGATGIGSVANLPNGLSASWASDIITISGTPTAAGTFNYSIPLTGGCGNISATGTITVTPNNIAGIASSSPSLCINTALTAITHDTTSASGITNSGIPGANGLPPGVSASWSANTISISGTPTTDGTFNYSIPLTGGCNSANATGTITVTPNNSVSAASSSPTLCIGTSLTAITHSTTGATGISNNGISGANDLPIGVSASWNSNTITISGTPTSSGTFNYSIPLIGGCGNIIATGTITVKPDNTIVAAPAPKTICIDTALTDLTVETTGAIGISGDGVIGANGLPHGINASWSSNKVTISGSPTIAGTFNYSIPLTGGCGNISATGTITVRPDDTVGAASAFPTLCINSSLTNITHSTTTATGISDDGITGTNGLPAGVSATWAANAITISGTPSQAGVFNYSIPLTGGCGNLNATGTITVNPLPANPGSITGSVTVCQGQNGVTYTVAPIANATGYVWTLPPNATIVAGANTNSIIVNYDISATSGNITVKGTNACGSGLVSANYPITVNITPYIATNYSPTVCSGEPLSLSPSAGGGNIVPAGTTYSWSLPSVTGGITGATALSGQTSFNQTLNNPTNTTHTATYNVTASTGGCSASTFSVLVTVYAKPTVNAIPTTQNLCSGANISAITISNPNGIAGTISYSWTRSNTANVTGGIGASGNGTTISGKLFNGTSVPQTTTFTVTATSQNGCESAPFDIDVIVNPIPTVSITPSSNQSVCSESPITNIVLSNPNSVSGTIFNWTRTNNNSNLTGIPDGSGSSISGALTNATNTAITSTFSITAEANACTSSATTVSVTVNPKPAFDVSLSSQTLCGGNAITGINIINSNGVAGTTYNWLRDKTTELTGIASSGSGLPISGTIANTTNVDQTTTFTITGQAGTCSSAKTATVTVKRTPAIVFTNPSQTICPNTSIQSITLSDSNNPTGTTYSWSRTTPAGLSGTLPASGTSNTLSGTLINASSGSLSTTITVLATASNGCTMSSTTNITVYAPIVAPMISATQTVCTFSTPAMLTSTSPTGGSGTYTYQWQSSSNSSGPWTNISGATNSTYQPLSTGSNGNNTYYQLITYNSCGNATSNIVLIQVVDNVGFTFNSNGFPTNTICPGTILTPSLSSVHADDSAVRFDWSADASYITPGTGGPTGTTGNRSWFFVWYRTSSADFSFTAKNNTNSTITTQIAITPNVYDYPGPPSGAFLCSITPQITNISIYPTPVATTIVPNTTICSGTSANIAVTGNITDVGNTTTFNWSVNNNANISGDNTSGTGSIGVGGTFTINNILTNNSTSPQTVDYTIIPESNGCYGTAVTVTITVAPAVTPGTIASNQTICSGGDPAAFIASTAATGGGTLTYQWQSSTSSATGPWTDINSATALSYDAPTGLATTTWFKRNVYATFNGVTCSNTSGNTVQVTVNSINPGTISGSQTICSGVIPVGFTNTAAATGGSTPTYQWEISTTDCNSGFTNISGATLATYVPSTGITQTSYYRRKATSTLNSVQCTDYSNCITVLVNDVTAGTIGSDQTICGNNPDAFTEVTSATGSGTLSYAWEKSTVDCNMGFSTISGATSATYDAPGGLTSTTYYKRIVTSQLAGKTCSATGNCITVTANSLTPGAIAGNRTVCNGGDPAAFTISTAATGSGLNFQWQRSSTATGPWENINVNGGNETYDEPGPVYEDSYYRRIATATVNSTDCSAISNYVIVYVNKVTTPVISGDQTICSTADPTALTILTPATGSGTISHKWQRSTTGCSGAWSDITGAIGSIYDPPVLGTSTNYQVTATSTLNGVACVSNSSCAVVTVNALPTVTFDSQPGASSCPMTDLTYTTQPGMSNYIWGFQGILNTDYIITSGGSSTSNSVTIKYLKQGSKTVSVNYTNTNGCTSTLATTSASTTVSLLVDNTGTGFSSSSFCKGNQATITFNADNLSGTPPYTLEYQNNSNNSISTVIILNDDETAFNLDPNPTATTHYTLLKITDSKGCVNTSPNDSTAEVTVLEPPATPTIGSIVQSTCTTDNSIVVSGLPTTNWTLNPVATTGSVNSKLLSSLAPGTYNFTVTENATGCTSLPSSTVTLVPPIAKRWAGATGPSGADWFNASNWIPQEVPTADDCVEIPNNSITVTIDNSSKTALANTLKVKDGGKLEVKPGNLLQVTNFVYVDPNGEMTLQNNAGLIQVNQSLNQGNVKVIRKTTPIILNDYTYWSSPTWGTQTLQNFSPNSNLKYFLTYENGWAYANPAKTTFNKATGYAILAPKGLSNTVPTTVDFQFTGTPNNGDISTLVVKNPSMPFSSKLIGNPYPSALDADKFILANITTGGTLNKTISGTLYFWTHSSALEAGTYSSDNYACYNLTGGTTAGKIAPGNTSGAGNLEKPTRWISSGQGFIVETLADGMVTFTNNMRIKDSNYGNGNFYKYSTKANSETILTKNRLWLNLTSGTSNFCQTLIGYIQSATNGFDPGFDGSYNGSSKIAIYSVLDNQNLTIQGRELPFNQNDLVPLGIKTETNGEMTLTIDSSDGFFAANQNIYIEDKYLGVIHNLKSAPYTFYSEAGSFNDRLVLRYNTDNLELNTPKDVINSVLISSKDREITIKSTSVDLEKVFVHDMLGRTIYENKEIGSPDLIISEVTSQQALIVKVVMTNGQTITQKIINE